MKHLQDVLVGVCEGEEAAVEVSTQRTCSLRNRHRDPICCRMFAECIEVDQDKQGTFMYVMKPVSLNNQDVRVRYVVPEKK
jgi:predicted protein tyrosine phosphatase